MLDSARCPSGEHDGVHQAAKGLSPGRRLSTTVIRLMSSLLSPVCVQSSSDQPASVRDTSPQDLHVRLSVIPSIPGGRNMLRQRG